MGLSSKRVLNPKKLLLSKWTAVVPQNKEKHFLVTKLVPVELPVIQIEMVELEAVHSCRSFVLPWRDLLDPQKWLQDWR